MRRAGRRTTHAGGIGRTGTRPQNLRNRRYAPGYGGCEGSARQLLQTLALGCAQPATDGDVQSGTGSTAVSRLARPPQLLRSPSPGAPSRAAARTAKTRQARSANGRPQALSEPRPHAGGGFPGAPQTASLAGRVAAVG